MKKRTSKQSMILRSLLLIPVTSLLLFGFSTKRVLPKISDTSKEKTHYAARSLSIEILDDGAYLIEENIADKSTFSEVINTFNQDISPEIRNNILNIHLSSSGEISDKEVWFIYHSFLEYGFYRIVAPNQEIIRPKGNTPFAIEDDYNANKGVSKKELGQYNALAKKYDTVPIEKRTIPLDDLKVLERIYHKMTQAQKKNAQTFPECLPKNQQQGATRQQMAEYNALAKKYYELPVGSIMSVYRKTSMSTELKRISYIYSLMSDKQKEHAEPYPFLQLKKYEQESATREQMAEYDALARKYNEMDRNTMRIQMKEVERLEYIYSIMSDKQKADAEPFPDFPEPPPPPPAPEVVEVEPKGEKVIPTLRKFDARGKDGSGETQAPPTFRSPPEVREVPPPPPTPPDPLDHVINMAKKGAEFYYEGKKISSDQAIKLLKKNKSLNIDSRSKNTKKPKVRISKDPIRINTTSEKASSSTPDLKMGNTKINGKDYFYTTKNGLTSYFNSQGEQVDQKGRKPTFYLNGQKISSVKAHDLLKNNTSIQVTNEEYNESEYAIVLTDLNNFNGQKYTKNENPNSLIDLTEMIAKEAQFFFNDEPISAEKAQWLTKNEQIERVQTVGSKKGKPKVYFWKKV